MPPVRQRPAEMASHTPQSVTSSQAEDIALSWQLQRTRSMVGSGAAQAAAVGDLSAAAVRASLGADWGRRSQDLPDALLQTRALLEDLPAGSAVSILGPERVRDLSPEDDMFLGEYPGKPLAQNSQDSLDDPNATTSRISGVSSVKSSMKSSVRSVGARPSRSTLQTRIEDQGQDGEGPLRKSAMSSTKASARVSARSSTGGRAIAVDCSAAPAQDQRHSAANLRVPQPRRPGRRSSQGSRASRMTRNSVRRSCASGNQAALLSPHRSIASVASWGSASASVWSAWSGGGGLDGELRADVEDTTCVVPRVSGVSGASGVAVAPGRGRGLPQGLLGRPHSRVAGPNTWAMEDECDHFVRLMSALHEVDHRIEGYRRLIESAMQELLALKSGTLGPALQLQQSPAHTLEALGSKLLEVVMPLLIEAEDAQHEAEELSRERHHLARRLRASQVAMGALAEQRARVTAVAQGGMTKARWMRAQRWLRSLLDVMRPRITHLANAPPYQLTLCESMVLHATMTD